RPPRAAGQRRGGPAGPGDGQTGAGRDDPGGAFPPAAGVLPGLDGPGDRRGPEDPPGDREDAPAGGADQGSAPGGRARTRLAASHRTGRRGPAPRRRAMNCLSVRERLAEYALDTLELPLASDVERHLEGCAGCRKESEELRDGAAVLAFDLPTVAPPTALGARVIGRVVRARGIRPHRRSRRAWRVAGAAGLAAAIFAAAALASAVHTRDMQLQELKANAARKNKQIDALTGLIDHLRREQALNGT